MKRTHYLLSILAIAAMVMTGCTDKNLDDQNVTDNQKPTPEVPVDPEKPDPENPEKPDPENPNPENPDPEKPDPENPDPEQPSGKTYKLVTALDEIVADGEYYLCTAEKHQIFNGEFSTGKQGEPVGQLATVKDVSVNIAADHTVTGIPEGAKLITLRKQADNSYKMEIEGTDPALFLSTKGVSQKDFVFHPEAEAISWNITQVNAENGDCIIVGTKVYTNEEGLEKYNGLFSWDGFGFRSNSSDAVVNPEAPAITPMKKPEGGGEKPKGPGIQYPKLIQIIK